MAGSPAFPKLRGPDSQASRVQDNIAAQLAPLARALAATPIMGSAAPNWVAPDLVAGFANYGAPYAVAGYHKDALGYFHGKGVIRCAAGCAAGTTFLTLPMGYRPRETQRFTVMGVAGQFVTVTAAGVVSVGALLAAGDTIDFAFTFLAEQ